ncbi:hypothetical protein T12_1607 [Trichinella patagoniensis]|uniref:Uncharacterized protein n=1 Tax=Trichinella patagoniensis TaxID=990121 RepID=A0A0V1A5I5_9BILA|nr:hypothetical protein T12_1607 [Trichinella patagoniensis]
MAQVGCRRSVACLSFRSMTDLGYYYSPMAGDHLTITGHTGAPAGTGKLFQQTDGSLIRLELASVRRCVPTSCTTPLQLYTSTTTTTTPCCILDVLDMINSSTKLI